MKRARNFEQCFVVGFVETATANLALENVAPQLRRSLLLLDTKTLPDLVPSSAGANVVEPVARRLGRRRCDDLHRLGILQLARQRGDASVDPCPRRVESDLGVHG